MLIGKPYTAIRAAMVLMAAGIAMSAQQNGNLGGPPMLGSSRHQHRPWIMLNGRSTPDRVEDDEDEKRFEQAMAVQATSEQTGAYHSMTKTTAEAMQQLRVLKDLVEKKSGGSTIAHDAHLLNKLLDSAQYQNRQFLSELSKEQHTTFRDITLKLANADADLAHETSILNVEVEKTAPDVSQIASSTKSLDQLLASLHAQQRALGDQMGIELEQDEQALTFDLAPVKDSIQVENQPVTITVGGTLSKIAANGEGSDFQLRLTADLSDLQQRMTEILASKLNKADRCGEIIEVGQATLSAQDPASVVVSHLRYQRWMCFPGGGGATLLAAGAGTVEVKVTPIVEKDTGVRLISQFGHVEADGMLGEQLRSGSLGEDIRNAVTQSLTIALQAVLSFEATLPAAAQDDATLQKIMFREADGLHATVAGHIRIPEQEVKVLAVQLKTNHSDR